MLARLIVPRMIKKGAIFCRQESVFVGNGLQVNCKLAIVDFALFFL